MASQVNFASRGDLFGNPVLPSISTLVHSSREVAVSLCDGEAGHGELVMQKSLRVIMLTFFPNADLGSLSSDWRSFCRVNSLRENFCCMQHNWRARNSFV